MASHAETVDWLVGQMAEAGAISARKMFGEYGVYCDGVFFGVICDDTLFVKDTDAGRALIAAPDLAPPYPGARPHLRIGAELQEDTQALAALLRATVAALPVKKKR